jgi:transcriptional regulator with XRE-family HTH domain
MPYESETRIIQLVVKELANIRNANKLSKNALSEMTGLSRRSIQFIEEGKRSPTLLSLLKIAHAMDLDLGKIITKKDAKMTKG